MTKTARARYTLEFKQEAVRLVEAGQSIAAAARTLGVVDQTLYNWVKAQRQGKLQGADSKVKVSAEQMEISRLRAELARVKMERDILCNWGQIPIPIMQNLLALLPSPPCKGHHWFCYGYCTQRYFFYSCSGTYSLGCSRILPIF